MPGEVSYEFSWDDTVEERGSKAMAKAMVLATDVGVEVSRAIAPIVYGAYFRSIHAADAGYGWDADADVVGINSYSGVDLSSVKPSEPDEAETNFGVEFGSGVPYAQDIEDRDAVLQAGVDAINEAFIDILAEELANEGLGE